MNAPAETIDMTPSREGYINMLTMIVENSTKADDIEWAKVELEKLGVNR